MVNRRMQQSNSLIIRRPHRRIRWLLVTCAVALTAGPIFAMHLDAVLSGELEPLIADAPSDAKHPFKETRSEARIRTQFREPETAQETLEPSASTPPGNSDTPDIAPELMQKAHKFYAERCASCHGEKGNGDGPGAFAIKPRPRDYTDPAWQESVTDGELVKAIVRGGAAVGKSYMMPASYDLRSKPELTAALVALVRSFASK